MVDSTTRRAAMNYRVEIEYPAPTFEELDELLLQLARADGGRWIGSGVGLVEAIARRDIEFEFNSEGAANAFVRKCSFLTGVRVMSVKPAN